MRPLARRGYSREGLELGRHNLVPELTVNLDGMFWHPLSTDADMQVSKQMFPLATAVERVQGPTGRTGGNGHAAADDLYLRLAMSAPVGSAAS